jgi:hypothetical protein
VQLNICSVDESTAYIIDHLYTFFDSTTVLITLESCQWAAIHALSTPPPQQDQGCFKPLKKRTTRSAWPSGVQTWCQQQHVAIEPQCLCNAVYQWLCHSSQARTATAAKASEKLEMNDKVMTKWRGRNTVAPRLQDSTTPVAMAFSS